MTDPHANGGRHAQDRTDLDPAYDLPVVGPLLREADRMRTRAQGRTLTRKEAELLRTEARALRHLANYLDARAAQLERHVATTSDRPRITRIRLDGP